MAGNQDMQEHVSTYTSVMRLFKYSTITLFVIAMLIIITLAN